MIKRAVAKFFLLCSSALVCSTVVRAALPPVLLPLPVEDRSSGRDFPFRLQHKPSRSIDSSPDRSTILAVRTALLDTANSYLAHETVPYVWGGNKIGPVDVCAQCSACILKHKKRGVKKRHLRCSACSSCGMDCSHFVQKVFEDAGLRFPFSTTGTMQKVSAKQPDFIAGLRFVGTDLSEAQPGDLLVMRKHVVILMSKPRGYRADVLHVSRSVRGQKVGGIELRRDIDVRRFYGGVRKILRHERLIDSSPQNPFFSPELPRFDLTASIDTLGGD